MNNGMSASGQMESLLKAIEGTGQFKLLADALTSALQTDCLGGKKLLDNIKNSKYTDTQQMKQKLQAFLAEHQGEAELKPIKEALGMAAPAAAKSAAAATAVPEPPQNNAIILSRQISSEQREAKTEELQKLMTDTFSKFGGGVSTTDLGVALKAAMDLIRAGADPTATDSNGQTVLHFAAQSRKSTALNELIAAAKESGQLPALLGTLATPDTVDGSGVTPMFNLMKSMASSSKLKELLETIEGTKQFELLANALASAFKIDGFGPMLLKSIQNSKIGDAQQMKQQLQAFLANHQDKTELNPIRNALGMAAPAAEKSAPKTAAAAPPPKPAAPPFKPAAAKPAAAASMTPEAATAELQTLMTRGIYSTDTGVFSNNLKKAEDLIRAGADPTTKNARGYMPLHVVMYQGSAEDVKNMLEAIKSKNSDKLQAALDARANLGSGTATPLHFAFAETPETTKAMLNVFKDSIPKQLVGFLDGVSGGQTRLEVFKNQCSEIADDIQTAYNEAKAKSPPKPAPAAAAPPPATPQPAPAPAAAAKPAAPQPAATGTGAATAAAGISAKPMTPAEATAQLQALVNDFKMEDFPKMVELIRAGADPTVEKGKPNLMHHLAMYNNKASAKDFKAVFNALGRDYKRIGELLKAKDNRGFTPIICVMDKKVRTDKITEEEKQRKKEILQTMFKNLLIDDAESILNPENAHKSPHNMARFYQEGEIMVLIGQANKNATKGIEYYHSVCEMIGDDGKFKPDADQNKFFIKTANYYNELNLDNVESYLAVFGDDRYSLAHIAVINGRMKELETILENLKVDQIRTLFEFKTASGKTPIELARESGHPEIADKIQELLNKAQKSEELYYLVGTLAAKEPDINEVVKIIPKAVELIKEGANLAQRYPPNDNTVMHALMFMLSRSDGKDFEKILDAMTPEHIVKVFALKNDQSENAISMLRFNLYHNVDSPLSRIALEKLEEARTKLVELTTEEKVNPNQALQNFLSEKLSKDGELRKSEDLGVFAGKMANLFEAGADLAEIADESRNALSHLIAENYQALVFVYNRFVDSPKGLAALKAMLVQKNDEGNTPLHLAFDSLESLEIMINVLKDDQTALVEALTKPNEEGKTPMDLVWSLNRTSKGGVLMIDALREFPEGREALKAVLVRENDEGNTPLHLFAGSSKELEVMIDILKDDQTALLKALTEPNKEGKTPIDLTWRSNGTNLEADLVINTLQKFPEGLKALKAALVKENDKGNTPFHLVLKPNTTGLRALINVFEDDQTALVEALTKPNGKGKTLIDVMFKTKEAWKQLLVIDVLQKSSEGREMLKAMLVKENDKGNTLFHLSVYYPKNLKAMIDILEDDPKKLVEVLTKPNKEGKTPIDLTLGLADEDPRIVFIDALQKSSEGREVLKAVLVREDNGGNTPLHLFAKSFPERLEIMLDVFKDDPKKLVEVLTKPNKKGMTLIALARVGGHGKEALSLENKLTNALAKLPPTT
jgi:ankyrin repeat protein